MGVLCSCFAREKPSAAARLGISHPSGLTTSANLGSLGLYEVNSSVAAGGAVPRVPSGAPPPPPVPSFPASAAGPASTRYTTAATATMVGFDHIENV